MAEEQVEIAVAAPKSAKRKPRYSRAGKLVMDAILNLNEKKGSSIIKIRSYISAQNPEIDMTRYGIYIKKFILSAVESGELKTNNESKGVRGFFKIVAEKKKTVQKMLEKSSNDENLSTPKKKAKNNSSPKVKKPVSKTVKMPSAVAASTIKKKKAKSEAKASTVEKDSTVKGKKKATGTKRSKKTEDETPVPKKLTKKNTDDSKPKPRVKAKPKKAKTVESMKPENAGTEAVEKVVATKGKKKVQAEKPKKVAAKKKKVVKVDDESKE